MHGGKSFTSFDNKKSLDVCILDCLSLINDFQKEDHNAENTSSCIDASTDSLNLTTFNLSSFEMTPDDLIAHLKYQKLLRLPPRTTSLNRIPKSK